MKHLLFYFSIALLLSCSNHQEKNYAALVDPFIGTGGHGHTYPGASSPFGFVQLSPDSRLEGWDGCGGYHYTDTVIYGFSHTHLSGTGVSDYGDILLMPSPKFEFNNGYGIHPDSGYGSTFQHKNESAQAGFYQVMLDEGEIQVDLTAKERSGMHRYIYGQRESEQYLILDLQHRDQLLDYSIEPNENRQIKGRRISKAWAQEQHLYYFIELSEEFDKIDFNADSSKAIFTFNGLDSLLIKIGISAVDVEGAEKNLHEEIPHWSFEKVRKEVQEQWNKRLSRIEVDMPNDSDEVIFYTALYHSLLNPNIFNDIDGRYRSTDLEIHQSNGFEPHTIFSLWDTYRATHPLFTIIEQQKTVDFINTFLDHYKNGGKLPVWELAANYTGCMIGYHAVPVIVDAYMKGIRDFDTQLALEAMVSTARANELGKKEFAEYGYMSMDQEHESVSKNLEYAYDDWCIAIYAKELGQTDIYKEFLQRAQNYKNIFDPQHRFMRAKRNQQFTEPFDPREVNFNFTEANSWQYSFYVPQDINGLMAMHGGKEAFSSKLDSLFNANNKTSGRHQVDITGLVGQYAHGNEPSHHMAYLYNYADQSFKSQLMARKLLDEMYTSKPDGLIGNEDCGQMSSWYVLSSMGFYPVTPGSSQYSIGSPLIKKATIHLENGNEFTVQAINNNEENVFIQKLSLNGVPLHRSYLEHEEILSGGELIFEMGSQANDKLFDESASSSINEELITAVPFIIADGQIFSDSLLIKLSHPQSEVEIQYALNDESYVSYEEPFYIYDNSDLRIKAKAKGAYESKEGKAIFYKLIKNKTVSYNYPYNPQYSAGGKDGLVDLIRGGEDFRTGYWQGFQGQDVEITIVLDNAEEISGISAGFLQDINSWIWMPQEVEFMISKDGVHYESKGIRKNQIPFDQYGVFLQELKLDFAPVLVQSVKLKAKQFGTIPDWHLGKGGESFIFIDEVIIQ